MRKIYAYGQVGKLPKGTMTVFLIGLGFNMIDVVLANLFPARARKFVHGLRTTIKR